MGKGRRIQDFRTLNLDTPTKKDYKKNNAKSSIKEKEFIIEVEEKPKKTNKIDNKKNKAKKEINKKRDTTLENESYLKKHNENNQKIENKKLNKKQSPKTYKEEEIYKNKKENRKRTSLIVSSFLVIFIVIGVIAGCLTTPTFDIKYIEVEDGKNITSGEIQRFFSNVKGRNTFLMDTKEINARIEEHPYIYKAEISRKLPDKLTVKYIEREPYASIKYIESYVLIDKYGNILEILKENKYPDLPIIYGIESESFTPGQKLEGVANLKFENTVYLLETAEHVSFENVISEINYTDSENIKFSMKELDVQIIYGTIEREILTDKITYLNEILRDLENKKGTLDISSENYSAKTIFTEIIK